MVGATSSEGYTVADLSRRGRSAVLTSVGGRQRNRKLRSLVERTFEDGVRRGAATSSAESALVQVVDDVTPLCQVLHAPSNRHVNSTESTNKRSLADAEIARAACEPLDGAGVQYSTFSICPAGYVSSVEFAITIWVGLSTHVVKTPSDLVDFHFCCSM